MSEPLRAASTAKCTAVAHEHHVFTHPSEAAMRLDTRWACLDSPCKGDNIPADEFELAIAAPSGFRAKLA